jgi:predicted nucleotide-binding protein
LEDEPSYLVTAKEANEVKDDPGSRIVIQPNNKVFLVHGRDPGALHEVARFLEKIGLDVTILHERPNKGRTLISKFEEESADIGYAVVLMTADDLGGLRGAKPAERARQNVVFELGFFIGRLGAQNVCALISPGIERPSDFEAVVYIELDGGKWKTELARELRAAGVPFDHSKVF